MILVLLADTTAAMTRQTSEAHLLDIKPDEYVRVKRSHRRHEGVQQPLLSGVYLNLRTWAEILPQAC